MIELKITGQTADDLSADVARLANLLSGQQEDFAHTQELMRLTYDSMMRLLKEFGKVEPVTEWLLDSYGESRIQDVPLYYWPEIAAYWTEALVGGAK